jgi:hypothetical protein
MTEPSDKFSYPDLFSTDIDVIRRNIEFGTYKEIDVDIILETNRMLHEKIMENTEDAIEISSTKRWKSMKNY